MLVKNSIHSIVGDALKRLPLLRPGAVDAVELDSTLVGFDFAACLGFVIGLIVYCYH